ITQRQPDALLPTSWAAMVRDNEVSHDGWYWANPDFPPNGNPPILTPFAVTTKDFFGPPPITEDPTWYPTGTIFEPLADGSTKKPDVVYPYSMYGEACLNCHSSAAGRSTFASLDNILRDGLHYKFFAATESSSSQLLLGLSRPLHSGEPSGLSATSSSGYVNP